MHYPESSVDTGQLLFLSVKGWWQAFKSTILAIAAFVALKALFTHIPILPAWIELTWVLITILIAIFLYIFSLYRVDAQWRGQPCTVTQAWQLTQKNVVKAYLACLGIVAALWLVFLLVRWLTFSIFKMQGIEAAIIMMLFAAIPMIFILIYFYLMLPLLTVFARGWYEAFYQSALCARENIGVMLVIYGEVMVMFLIASSATRHGQWLLNHHLMELCDLLVFSLLVPLWLNLTLLLLQKNAQA